MTPHEAINAIFNAICKDIERDQRRSLRAGLIVMTITAIAAVVVLAL